MNKIRFGKIRLSVLAVILLAALLFAGCGKPAEAPQAEAPAVPAAAGPQAPAGAVTVPPDVQALVTFVSGRAEKLEGGSWSAVGIGDNLPQASTVRVGEKSFCELQFGNTAVIRVHESTEVRLEKILLASAANQVDVRLDSGSVLAKVSKLSGKDKFQVRTGNAVCGVRGTEFGVSSGRDGRTILKVKSGTVAVLPSTADVETIGGKSAEADAKTREIVEAAAAQIIEAAPLVKENQEIIVTPEITARTESLIKIVQQEIAKLSETPPDTEREKQLAVFTEKISADVGRAMNKPAQITEENKKTLEVISSMVMLELPAPAPAPAAAAQAPAASEAAKAAEPAKAEPPAPEKKVNLLTVSVSASPEDADILMNGVVVGRGSLQRIFPEGAKAVFRVVREGYEPRDLSVDVELSTLRDIKVELQPKPKNVSIETDPRDAEITIDGKVVGKGRYAAAFLPGRSIKVGVRKAGFEEKIVEIPVTIDMAPAVKIALGKVSKEVSVTVEPRDARIFLGSDPLGTGAYKGVHNAGDRLVFRFQRDGFKTESAAFEVKEQGDNVLTVRLSPEPRELSVSVSPAAAVYLDGKVVGRGVYRGRHEVGETLRFTFRENGYYDKELKVDVTLAAAAYRVELDPKPIFARFKAAESRIVGLAAAGERLVGSDSAGRVFCVTSDGKVLWTAASANSPNENSVPSVIGGRVYFSGAKELLILDAGSGSVLARRNLDAASVNPYGLRPAALPAGILFPAGKSLLVKNSETGETLKSFPLGFFNLTSPLVHKDKIYIADPLGKVHVLDAETGRETASFATAAGQPVAGMIQVSGGQGYFAGRRGDVAAFDLEKGAVLWQAKLTADSSAAVFQDLVVSGRSVYAFSKNTLYRLDAAAGSLSAEPVRDAAAPPAPLGGHLYLGTTDGRLLRLPPDKDRADKTLDLAAKPSARPEIFQGRLALGTEEGEIILVNPQGLR